MEVILSKRKMNRHHAVVGLANLAAPLTLNARCLGALFDITRFIKHATGTLATSLGSIADPEHRLAYEHGFLFD